MWNELEKNHLQSRLTRAELELAILRDRLRQKDRHLRRVEQAYEDALLMASWMMSDIHPGRERSARLGQITQRRWENAVALLRMARVVVRRRRWATNNQEVIRRKLEQAKLRAIQTPESFRARL